MAESKIKRQSYSCYSASIDLDSPYDCLGIFNGNKVTGTKPFEIQGGMGHIIGCFFPDTANGPINQFVISPYNSKMGIRTKYYTPTGWTWGNWKVINFSSS